MNSHNNNPDMGTDREYKEGKSSTDPSQKKYPSEAARVDKESGDETLGKSHEEKRNPDEKERREAWYAS